MPAFAAASASWYAFQLSAVYFEPSVSAPETSSDSSVPVYLSTGLFKAVSIAALSSSI